MTETEENFQLKWHSYQANFHDVVGALLASEAFSDATLVAGGRSVHAHRVVLSACSPYFHQVLIENPGPNPIIILPRDIPFRILQILLEFMYTGVVDVSQDNLLPVLQAGETLQIKGLCRDSEKGGRPTDDSYLASFVKQVQATAAAGKSQRMLHESFPVVLPRHIQAEPAQNGRTQKIVGQEVNLSQVPRLSSAEGIRKRRLSNSSTSCDLGRPDSHSGDGKEDPVTLQPSKYSKPMPEMPDSTRSSMAGDQIMIENITTASELNSDSEMVFHVKEEPVEWSDDPISPAEIDDHTSSFAPEGTPTELTIKPDIELCSEDYTPLTCDLCHETFPTASGWVHHLRTHPEERRAERGHPCEICSKRFSSRASLLIHTRTHTGEQPYQCDVCCKGFNVKSNLIRHLRTLHGKIVGPSEIEER